MLIIIIIIIIITMAERRTDGAIYRGMEVAEETNRRINLDAVATEDVGAVGRSVASPPVYRGSDDRMSVIQRVYIGAQRKESQSCMPGIRSHRNGPMHSRDDPVLRRAAWSVSTWSVGHLTSMSMSMSIYINGLTVTSFCLNS